ncbi:MAG: carboxypeptidase-like regulatory domain-containing protein [Bacteroidales bacterium]
MLRNLLLTIGFILSTTLVVFSQSGTLKGKIIDKDTKEAIPFANVVVESGGTQAGGATTDFDGNFVIKPIDPGTYDLRASYIGYKTVLLTGLVINSDQITFYNVDMESTTATLEEIVVESYLIPLIDKDKLCQGEVLLPRISRKCRTGMPTLWQPPLVVCSQKMERGQREGSPGRSNRHVH